MFSGRLKITVCAAKDLQHTNFMTRHGLAAMGAGGGGGSGGSTETAPAESPASSTPGGARKESVLPGLDPYVQIDVDEVAIERTSTKVSGGGSFYFWHWWF